MYLKEQLLPVYVCIKLTGTCIARNAYFLLNYTLLAEERGAISV